MHLPQSVRTLLGRETVTSKSTERRRSVKPTRLRPGFPFLAPCHETAGEDDEASLERSVYEKG